MRARTVAGLSLLAIAVWWWWGDDPAPRHHGETAPQVAVTHEGFVTMRGDGHGTLRLSELGRDGKERRELSVASPSDEVRVVGSRLGMFLVWRDPEKRLVRARHEQNGRWSDAFESPNVHALCDGVASNEHNAGVGWVDDRGRVWFLYSLMQAMTEMEVNGPASWCAITAAGSGVGLLWRERNATRINLCSRGKCPMPETVDRELAKRPILAFGCIANHCVVVTRAASGRAEATMLTRRGRRTWTRPLPDDLDGDAVTAIGAGDDHFVIAYGLGDRAEAIAIDSKGDVSTIWRGAAAGSTAAPAIAWSRGQLAIARLHEGVVVTELVALPRVTP